MPSSAAGWPGVGEQRDCPANRTVAAHGDRHAGGVRARRGGRPAATAAAPANATSADGGIGAAHSGYDPENEVGDGYSLECASIGQASGVVAHDGPTGLAAP